MYHQSRRWLCQLLNVQSAAKKIRSEYEISCTGDVKRNVEKAPWCCGRELIESIDD